jgi:hypothetical protein
LDIYEESVTVWHWHETLHLSPIVLLISLVIGVFSPVSHCQQFSAANEFGIWGAYSVNSPHVYGSLGHGQFGVLAFRYARILNSSPSFAIEYTIDVAPVEVTHQVTYATCLIPVGGGSYLVASGVLPE